MSRSYYRFIRIVVFSLLLIPVCGVLAGEEPSWRVRMPVIVPLESLIKNAEKFLVSYIPDVKRPVTDIVISSDPFKPGEADRAEPAVVAADSIEVESEQKKDTGAESAVTTHEEESAESVRANMLAAILPQGAASAGFKQDSEHSGTKKSGAGIKGEGLLRSPSVSLVPSDNAEIKQVKGSEDGSFFVSPKRLAGLSGKVVKATPSINVRETYDSNVDYKSIEDLVTEITPTLKLEIIDEDMNITFRGDFIYRDYLRYQELDRYDYSVNLSGNYNFSPLLNGGLNISHKRYHNLDQNAYEAGGVDLEPTLILKTTATPDLNWRLGERDNIRFSNYFDKTDYERKADSDYVTNVFSTVWGHAFANELTTLFIGQMDTFTHFSREIDDLKSDQVSFQAVVGVDHQFTPALKFSIKGGPGITFSNYSNVAGRGESQDLLYQFRAELSYRQLYYEIIPAIERVVRPGRYGENEVLDQAELYFRYELTEYFTFDMINTYWLSESDGGNGGERHKSSGLFTQSVLNWIFKKDWSCFLGLSYNHGRNEITSATDERFKTWVGISYAFPTEIN